MNVLQTKRSSVAIALWFQAASGWLRGSKPMDLVRATPSDLSDVLGAAHGEIAPIEHG